MIRARLLLAIGAGWALSALAGCAGSVAELKNNRELKKIAVVSLATVDWWRTVDHASIGDASTASLMQGATGTMLAYTEQTLAKHWQVKRAETFAANAAYQKAAEKVPGKIHSPIFGGKKMPLFGTNYIKGEIAPEKARELCRLLNVDAVMLVYSEWAAATGHHVPVTRALTKNVFSVWDKHGQKLFHQRIDTMGSRVLGAMGVKAVTSSTINEWVGAYKDSLRKMFKAV